MALISTWRKSAYWPISAASLALIFIASAAFCGIALAKSPSDNSVTLPNWEDIFNQDGTPRDDFDEFGASVTNGVPDYLDLNEGVEAQFMPDELSDGIAIDMSAFLPGESIADQAIYRGAVRTKHDLGNAFMLSRFGGNDGLQYFAGVERVATNEAAFVDFEFTQQAMTLGAMGDPWTMQGESQAGDLRIRMTFSGHELSQVTMFRFDEGAFHVEQTYDVSSTGACHTGKGLSFCVGEPMAAFKGLDVDVFDEQLNPVQPAGANQFLELGFDTRTLTGAPVEFSTIMVRTPEDIVFNTFNRVGELARIDDPLKSTLD